MCVDERARTIHRCAYNVVHTCETWQRAILKSTSSSPAAAAVLVSVTTVAAVSVTTTVICYIVIRWFFFFIFVFRARRDRPAGQRKLYEKGDRESDTDYSEARRTIGARARVVWPVTFFLLRDSHESANQLIILV